MTQLLPCPFCGSNDLYQTEHRYYVEVYCDCGATNDSEKWNTRASQWISVKDKLPEYNEIVLTCEKKNNLYDVNVGHYQNYTYENDIDPEWIEESEGRHIDVTHWQPLPSIDNIK